jgi:hypothetical protein
LLNPEIRARELNLPLAQAQTKIPLQFARMEYAWSPGNLQSRKLLSQPDFINQRVKFAI